MFNASDNIDEIKVLCSSIPNCSIIKLNFNSGVAYALMKGVHYAVVNYRPEWLLFLDDDTMVLRNAVKTALTIYEKTPINVKRIGLIKLSTSDGDCKIYETHHNAFSGTLIKSHVAVKTCCRVNFFLDQADHDLYARVRE
ncbi:hypothetical protein GCM10007981_00900 [Thermocladium modestius]|uniref:Glycosyltransferase 2-like domain-containing protein n=1 Tax=Thermocladium modestius TaxID=62609 RepID=A0A830GRN3_9CREN|nr:glycosyltransferase [Thermocladium modestius]GGP18997.1 hypothetical protein GCM10007981_00900 [Thermocladium modestius]